ncbi:haloacid dehalogenase-like hydrolase [Halioglobus maricola]|uniref:Haloacid dehalogenase-like hydrolase n=1 Tax=Halioglobus maricola TaxID=2601894 RepID=A0A5P9NN34_9GAMM|nr:HAD family hydrolase [Halioglobus maricola]QFU77231.1 haloacid dehalogenase-like hydrolase [Halioglobus maricola]
MPARLLAACLAALLVVVATPLWAGQAPLSSWQDGSSRKAIEAFVAKVSTEGSPAYVPPAERIAVFDNDGTLWAEQPMYFQLIFAVDRVKAMAPEHPEWKAQEPFASVLKGDIGKALAGGTSAILELVGATHGNITTDEFDAAATAWLETARHPRTGLKYNEMVYLPMLELLDYLRANDFATYIVSGGGIDFMRPWTEEVYGIPPEQVVGSSVKTTYEVRDGVPTLVRAPEIDFIDDKEGKPVGIHSHIGRRPIMAVGNSDGDFQMLEWVTAREGASLGVIIHHTDAEREWAYDRDSHIGRLDRGLDEGPDRGWVIVDMKNEWRQVFPTGGK